MTTALTVCFAALACVGTSHTSCAVFLGFVYVSGCAAHNCNYNCNYNKICHFTVTSVKNYLAAVFAVLLLSALPIRETTTATITATATRPGTKPAPTEPVVITVPIWYTRNATV